MTLGTFLDFNRVNHNLRSRPVSQSRQTPVLTLVMRGLPHKELPECPLTVGHHWQQLRPETPVLSQITAALDDLRSCGGEIREVHLIGHGSATHLKLADQIIDKQVLLSNRGKLATWDIDTLVLWSCRVGQNDSFISILEELTGAEVYASDQDLHSSLE